MGTLHKQFWAGEGQGQTRQERKGGTYEYYLPTPLSKLDAALEPDVVGDVARAQAAIQKLNAEAVALHSSEGIARLLLRAEAVSSSHIEGLTIGTRRLLKAEASLCDKSYKHDEAAAEVLGNIHAMQDALAAAEKENIISAGTILGIHRTLCLPTKIKRFAGVVRDRQNWIGGNSYNPLGAEYVPPAPEHVMDLLDDIAAYCNDETIAPVLQAALAHAQFESVHPFIDGNGRTGRALIHLILRRRGLAPNLVPPISLVLATHAKSYVRGLSGFRSLDSDPKGTRNGINEWVSFFAGACISACDEAAEFENRAARLQANWREALGGVRANSTLDLLLRELVGMPLFSVKTAAAITGRTPTATASAITRCLKAGFVIQAKAQKRNRSFEVPEVINEFNIFERRLASPAGDTKVSKPVRAVPGNLARRQGGR